MREISFRGKSVYTDEWVTGYYIGAGTLVKHGDEHWSVDDDTVGQFTGLTDKNGKRIFEGDIVRNADGYLFSAQYPFAVKFCDGNFCGDAGGFVYISGEEFRYCEVIGSIHDNPELLEVEE